MQFSSIVPAERISLFVKDILVFEETLITATVNLPFYADGYPGLLYHETSDGLIVSPHNKQMPELFLYGQTIKPIELLVKGPFRLIVFQLYPFVLRSLFNINPAEINDNCHDLTTTFHGKTATLSHNTIESQIETLIALLFDVFEEKKKSIDLQVNEAIQIIVANYGQIAIGSLCGKLHLTQRTLERRFLKEVGISARQFSKIIQFQQSFEQLASKDYNTLSDVVFRNGFADQSHFIRVFKAYTNKTPKHFS